MPLWKLPIINYSRRLIDVMKIIFHNIITFLDEIKCITLIRIESLKKTYIC